MPKAKGEDNKGSFLERVYVFEIVLERSPRIVGEPPGRQIPKNGETTPHFDFQAGTRLTQKVEVLAI